MGDRRAVLALRKSGSIYCKKIQGKGWLKVSHPNKNVDLRTTPADNGQGQLPLRSQAKKKGPRSKPEKRP